MTSILFSFKRIFHKSIALGLVLLKDHGLTPSRFDMLHVIFTHRGSMRQRELRRILGVSAPTVTRMLNSLEELGLVGRQVPAQGDQRQNEVSLTADGIERIRNAMRAMFHYQFAEEAVSRIVLFKPRDRIIARLNERHALESKLYFMRQKIGDTATLQYVATGMG